METKAYNFLKDEILKTERRVFAGRILATLFGYVLFSTWLSYVRETAPLWFVWTLIIAQWLLYFLIFIISHRRAQEIGLKTFGLIPFIILAALGKVNDWELVIIPGLIITMLIISARTKEMSAGGQAILQPSKETLREHSRKRAEEHARALNSLADKADHTVQAREAAPRKGSSERYTSIAGNMDDKELINSFNREVGNNGWTRARSSHLAALHQEFQRRGYDYSAVGTKDGLSFKRKIKLVDKKIVIDADPAQIIEYAEYSKTMPLDCPACGWRGTPQSSEHIEYHDDVLDVSCPDCDKMLLVVGYPLSPDFPQR